MLRLPFSGVARESSGERSRFRSCIFNALFYHVSIMPELRRFPESHIVK